ncbi:hypothetical protein [Ralstonia pseudosolanacearum]|uniref:hypothetical protein n=1 Tax=Ralstonia pseudosolanacearum TaxID=1310165 RepID=UPI0018D0B902|nr:hypothetical protein [Ralstonia pseudosolanacearum]
MFDPLKLEHGQAAEVCHEPLAVEGVFLLKGLGFLEVSPNELKFVLLHAHNIVRATLDKSA